MTGSWPGEQSVCAGHGTVTLNGTVPTEYPSKVIVCPWLVSVPVDVNYVYDWQPVPVTVSVAATAPTAVIAHPNPGKAADGKRMHRLEVDPTAAPTVQRIFAEYIAGRG